MRIGLRNIRFLSPIKNNLCKIVVFVPPSHSAKVREALSTSGAGQIGNYSGCSFASNGTGSFIPNHDASPYIGHPGQPESVGEVRLEMIIDKSLAGRAISEMLKAHPYEEPAYDIYPLMNDSPDLGFGAIGEFDEPISFKRFILDLKNILELESIKISHSPHVEVRKVALCAGSGVPFYDDAMRDGADIFITGDVKHHDFRRASTCRTILADVTHIGSEKFATEVMFNDFKKVFLNEIEIQTSKTKPVNAITI